MLKTGFTSSILAATAIFALCVGLGGCASKSRKLPEESVDAVPAAAVNQCLPVEIQLGKLAETERRLLERQRFCQDDKRRLEQALLESQKRVEELQKKLEALLAIDRDLRARGKNSAK